jgi:hypothetical protein
MAINYRVAFRRAVKMAREAEVLDPENVAGDMLEEIVRAIRAGKINAPTGRALRFALRTCMAGLQYGGRNHVAEYVDVELADTDVEREVFGRLTLQQLQVMWPDLTETERAAMSRWLLGGGPIERKRGKVLDNCRRNVIALLDGKKRDAKYLSGWTRAVA